MSDASASGAKLGARRGESNASGDSLVVFLLVVVVVVVGVVVVVVNGVCQGEALSLAVLYVAEGGVTGARKLY